MKSIYIHFIIIAISLQAFTKEISYKEIPLQESHVQSEDVREFADAAMYLHESHATKSINNELYHEYWKEFFKRLDPSKIYLTKDLALNFPIRYFKKNNSYLENFYGLSFLAYQEYLFRAITVHTRYLSLLENRNINDHFGSHHSIETDHDKIPWANTYSEADSRNYNLYLANNLRLKLQGLSQRTFTRKTNFTS